jgi:serine/threonine-protein kinase
MPTEQQLEKLAPREVLDGPHGSAIRRAAEERAAILDIAASLAKADRALLPDLGPTVNALVDRVAHVAQTLHRLDQSIDPRLVDELDSRIAAVESESESPEGQRRLVLLRRQRDTLTDLLQRRAALARQLDSAGLALGNLRLDLINVRSSGLQSALSNVSTATQDARALSREIDVMLDAAAEVRNL